MAVEGGAVETRVESACREFLACFEAMNDVRRSLRRVGTTPPVVTTMTCTGTLSLPEVPIDDVRLAMHILEEFDESVEEFVLDDVRDIPRARPPKRFRYQLPLRRRGKSLKLFHNGSVHATGCASPVEFLELVDALKTLLWRTIHVDVHLLGFDVHLINALFVLSCPATGAPLTIAPSALLAALHATAACPRADFDTERHPSVKVPVFEGEAKVATVCVFQTGSVSIMGAKAPAHVATAFKVVCETIDAHVPCAPDRAALRTTTARHPLALRDGYPAGAFWCCCLAAPPRDEA